MDGDSELQKQGHKTPEIHTEPQLHNLHIQNVYEELVQELQSQNLHKDKIFATLEGEYQSQAFSNNKDLKKKSREHESCHGKYGFPALGGGWTS